MKEKYTIPEMQLLNLSDEDVIRTSENELPFEPVVEAGAWE